MKKFLSGAMLAMALVGLARPAVAFESGVLSVPEAAAKGATHYMQFTWEDFTVSTTNAIQAFTNSIAAKTAVEFVGMILDVAADTGNTNYTGSCLIKVGDGSDDDLFLASTELASDGTEVWVKYGPPNSATVSATTTNLVYLNASSNVVTNALTVAVTSAGTIGELSRKLYTAAGGIVATFTPNAEEALSANTSLSVRLYFREFSFGK